MLGPGNWLDRLSDSLSEHEERRSSQQDGPARYELLGEISRGGMGIVYRAWDSQLGRDVALKVLRAEDGNTAEAHERFGREARLAASLHHPNIVPIYDTGVWNGQDYIAMQLIEGTTLDKAGLDLRTALARVRDAARALHDAHQKGIIHRDVKPSNLLLDRQGRIYVTDFGVARQSQVSASMTSPGTVVGTPAYMSPEQAMGLPADARSDVYSIGATLYELATGRPPHLGRDPLEAVLKAQAGEPETPRRLAPDLSKNVEAIILGAMERSREERYASAAALADDIDRYLGGERPLRRPRGTTYKIRRHFVRHPWRSTGTIVFSILLVLAGIAAGYWLRGRINWTRAQNESDPAKKRAYLKMAEFWVPAAADELATMEIREQAETKKRLDAETAKREKQEAALAETQRKEREKEKEIENFKEQSEAEQRKREIAEAYASAHKWLAARALPEARRSIELLKSSAPASYRELLPKLTELEFEAGIEELERLAAVPDVEAFAKRFAELSGDAYSPQRSRNDRLARSGLRLGLALAARERPAESLKWFDAAEALGLQDGDIFEKRGLALLDLEQWDRADRDFTRLRGFRPSDAKFPPKFALIALRKGRALASGGRAADAIGEFTDALKIDPKLAAAYHDRGLARHRANGQSREALEEELTRALALDPALKPAAEYRAVALAAVRAEAERLWGAESPAERAQAWNRSSYWLSLMLEKTAPGDSELLLERAKARRRLGELAGAIDDARVSLAARESAESVATLALLTYARAHGEGKKEALIRESLQLFERLEGLEPGSARAAYGRGLCRRALRENDAALAELTKADKAGRALPHGLLQSARLQLDRTQWAAAGEAAARAISAASTLSEEEFVGGLYESQKISRAAAVRILTRDAYVFRGEASCRLNEFASSIEQCSEAIRLDPTHSNGYLWRGYARYEDKRYREAQEDFKQVIQLTSNEDERKKATEWLNASTKRAKE
jgi:tetratricopeptide (TPR) repeat protein